MVLTRARNPMPALVRRALVERGLLEAYRARPPASATMTTTSAGSRAKRVGTRDERLAQTLDELARGDRYVGMAHHPAVDWTRPLR